ncbi:MAG: hypothetical protein ACP5PT_04740 [Brevinematia bacterium]|jgi:hypothetical protein
MRRLIIFLLFIFCLDSYGFLTKEESIFILKNHREKGFYYEGEVSQDTLKVILDRPTSSIVVFVNFSEGDIFEIVNVYSTVLVLDKKPEKDFLEYLLRANNYNKSLGFFYLYYDINLDKYFIDYCVRIRKEDLSKSSLISIIKYVGLYVKSSKKKLENLLE